MTWINNFLIFLTFILAGKIIWEPVLIYNDDLAKKRQQVCVNTVHTDDTYITDTDQYNKHAI